MLDRVTGKLLSAFNVIAAAWILLLAFVVFFDVTGRYFFNSPLPGAREIIANSVVAILFLQIPLAIRRGGMIRTTIVYDNAGPTGRLIIDTVAFVIGILFFVAIGVGGWGDMINGWVTRESEGFGALSVPVYPVRTITVAFSFLSAFVYLLLIGNLFTSRLTTREQD